jgi:hypothetical protein
LPFIIFDTVEVETPARAAISLIVINRLLCFFFIMNQKNRLVNNKGKYEVYKMHKKTVSEINLSNIIQKHIDKTMKMVYYKATGNRFRKIISQYKKKRRMNYDKRKEKKNGNGIWRIDGSDGRYVYSGCICGRRKTGNRHGDE